MPSESTESSSKFEIAETETFRKQLSKIASSQRIYARIGAYAYPLLQENPYFGPNIKRLKGEFAEYFRFRIGDYRIFYGIDETIRRVYVITIRHRKDAYRGKI